MTNVDKSKITGKKREVIETLCSPDFQGTVTELCAQVGVSRQGFYKWMRDPTFLAAMADEVKRYTDSELPRVWKSLLRRCDNGDVKAIRLFFEIRERTGATDSKRPTEGLYAALERDDDGAQ